MGVGVGCVVVLAVGGGGGLINIHGRSIYQIDRAPSHPCKAGAEHVGFSL